MPQKKYNVLFIRRKTLRKLVSQSSKIFKKIGTFSKSRRRYIGKKISQEKGSSIDIYPTEKFFNSEVVETKLPQSTYI